MSSRRFHPYADGSLCVDPIIQDLTQCIREKEEKGANNSDPILAFSPVDNVCRASIRCVADARIIDDPNPDKYELDVYNFSVDHLRHLFNLDVGVNPAVVVLATRIHSIQQSHTADPDVDNATMFVSIRTASTTLFDIHPHEPHNELLMDPTQCAYPSSTSSSAVSLTRLRAMEIPIQQKHPVEVRTHRHFWSPKALAYIDAAITGSHGFRSKQEADSMYMERIGGVTDLVAIRKRDMRHEPVGAIPVIAGSNDFLVAGRAADYPHYAIRRYHTAAHELAPAAASLALNAQRMLSNSWHRTMVHAIRADKLADAHTTVIDLRPPGMNTSSREHPLSIRTWRRVLQDGPRTYILPEFKFTVEIVGVFLL